jgi:hypothetical protein
MNVEEECHGARKKVAKRNRGGGALTRGGGTSRGVRRRTVASVCWILRGLLLLILPSWNNKLLEVFFKLAI